MSSPASIRKHPLHPMLVAFPVGLWMFSFIADLLRRFTANEHWEAVALYTMGGGIIGALLAAVPGLVDLLSLRNPRVKRLGIIHMVLNLAAVAVFTFDFFLRLNGNSGDFPLVLSVVGVLLIVVSGWLGAEMVYVHGVAVEPQ